MKRIPLLISIAASSLLASNAISIEQIVVADAASDNNELVSDTNLSRGTQRFGAKSIATLSTQANMNPYTVIAFSPSVNFTPVDQAGSNEPSYHDPIRIRGKSQSGPGGVYMINGMPVSSNPGGGKQMLDMENTASIDLLKGYLPVDKNLGFSSLIGKVDMHVLNPSKKAGATLSQSFGSDSFNRTFVRLDSGKLGDVALFGSLSRLASDKTKGAGDMERYNGMIGLSYRPNDAFKAELFAIHNADDHHNYASLSYAEAKQLDTYFNKDFATTQPSVSDDVNYYDWNRQSFDTTAVLANFEYRPTASDTLSLKPYYKTDKGDYWFSNAAKKRVMNWHMDHDLFGGTAAYEHKFSDALTSKAGYWYHKQQPPGPPSDQKKYKVVDGGLVYDGYGILADNDYHILQSPFIEFSGTIGRFDYTVGTQYQNFKIGALKSYTFGTNASTSADYDTAIANGTLDSWASVGAKSFNTWLPSLYLGFSAADDTTVYLDYARTYGFDVNLFPSYVSNRANFVSKGVTLQELWDKLNLELSDNIDLGVKTTVGAVTLNPSLFVSFVKNKQANVYDPEFNVSYPSNVGDALGYGAEFSAYGPISEALEFLTSFSYNRYTFTQNFQSSATTTVETDGKQLPDAPEYMAKAALSYHLRGWTVTPSVRYTSSRYGDVQNTQKIAAYTLVDLDASYRMHGFLGSESTLFRVTATNLTNEKHISTIIAADNFLAASTTASTYQTGAPLGLYASVNLKY